MDLQAANPVRLSCEKFMTEVLQTAEKAKPASVSDNAGGINLVDLARPVTGDKQPTTLPSTVKPAEVVTLPPVVPPTFHLEHPRVDADLNRKYVHLDPGAWNSDAAFRNIYENGVLKLLSDPDGKQQFGLRVSDQKSDRIPVVPIGRQQHVNDKGVALEFRLKF